MICSITTTPQQTMSNSPIKTFADCTCFSLLHQSHYFRLCDLNDRLHCHSITVANCFHCEDRAEITNRRISRRSQRSEERQREVTVTTPKKPGERRSTNALRNMWSIGHEH